MWGASGDKLVGFTVVSVGVVRIHPAAYRSTCPLPRLSSCVFSPARGNGKVQKVQKQRLHFGVCRGGDAKRTADRWSAASTEEGGAAIPPGELGRSLSPVRCEVWEQLAHWYEAARGYGSTRRRPCACEYRESACAIRLACATGRATRATANCVHIVAGKEKPGWGGRVGRVWVKG